METQFEYDGHIYDIADDVQIPDLGSLVGTAQAHDHHLRSYKGLYSDRDKLPKYDDMETGSDALLIDSDEGLHYLYYEKTTNEWYEA